MITVLMIDKHPICRQAGRLILEEAGIEQVIFAKSCADGYKLYRRYKPGVVIIDPVVVDGGIGGLRFIRQIRVHDSETRVLVLSMYDDATIVRQSLEAGASGYVLKDESSEELIKAVRSLSTGAPFLSAEIAKRIFEVAPSKREIVST